jgi:hypothetical protein
MMKKIFLGAVIVLVVLIVVAVMVAGFFLGAIVKTGMERVGPKITQVSIKVEAVDLSLLTGSARIKGLVVGNPDGCKTPQAIRVGSAAVGVNPFSVLSDKIIVRSVRIEAPEITFEGNPFSGNNLGKIMQNVNAAGKSGGPGSTNATAGTGNQPGRKIEVDDFLITGAMVHVSLSGVGAREMTLPLPDIHLTNLGKDNDGINPADLTRRVLGAITSATIKVVASAATNLGEGAGKAGVSNATKGLGGWFRKSAN